MLLSNGREREIGQDGGNARREFRCREIWGSEDFRIVVVVFFR
jgi:hypothetical protein